MSITCGNCTGKHPTVADVKACYAGKQVTVDESGHHGQAQGLPAFAMDPASDKQIGFVKRLLEDKDTSNVQQLFDGRIMETMMDVMAEKAVSKREVSDLISALKQCPYKASADGQRNAPNHYADLPEGKFATVGVTGADRVEFWSIEKPQEGRWAGRTFINGLTGAPGDWRKSRPSRAVMEAVADIIRADPQKAATLFGYKTKTCGKCSSPLSRVQSRAAGYGKTCATKNGWYYPDKATALRMLKEMGVDPSELDDGDEPTSKSRCTPGQKCESIDELCTRHQQEYQRRYGRASNE